MHPKKCKREHKNAKKGELLHRYLEEPKNKHLTEVTIEKDPDYDSDAGIYYDDWIPILILHVGSHVIEVTSPNYDSMAIDWVTNTLREQRRLCQGSGPLVVSLCAFKGRSSWKTKKQNLTNPYQAISICLGGSHVLFYRYDKSYDGPDFPIKPLMRLLEDHKVVVIGVEIKEIAKKLFHQWGLRITNPVDLRMIVASSYGKDAVWWPKYEKGKVVMDFLGLEEMAELVLEGTRLEKKPAKVLEADWSNCHDVDNLEMDLTKYAARDAFISYEIATKCIQKAGGLPSDS